MIFASICAGIEAASEAWTPMGWRAAYFSEIERFPCAVLAQRHGGVPNLGDMTKFKEWPNAIIDLLVGGTPCQSFSVAGLRKGLADPRGNLALTYLAIVDRYRPRWVVWENVPGVLSDERNAFGAFLSALAVIGYGFAYRILDAQYFGIPQRRRRVFVIGYLGNWHPAAAVLFERASLRGDHPPRREAGQGIAPTISARASADGGLGTDFDCGGGLVAFGGNNYDGPIDVATYAGEGTRIDFESETFIATIQERARIANVRRLTPRECERLQGFRDDYTLIEVRGKPAADGPRYRALGNSMAVPVMRWIGERIAAVDSVIAAPSAPLRPVACSNGADPLNQRAAPYAPLVRSECLRARAARAREFITLFSMGQMGQLGQAP